jgi:hypothetical protein
MITFILMQHLHAVADNSALKTAWVGIASHVLLAIA